MKKEYVFRFALAMCIFFLVYQFGVKPLFSNVSKPSANSGKWAEGLNSDAKPGYDVIVLGEDPEGIAAAVSAARLGAKTLLLAEGADLGGVISRCKLSQLEIPMGQSKKLLNGGILSEIYKELGNEFSLAKYMETVGGLVKNEKSLNVEFGVAFDSLMLEGGRIAGINALSGSEGKTYKGRFFIDATREGKLLDACKVPYTTGSEDLNLKNSFVPAALNFEMKGPIATDIIKLVQSKDGSLLKGFSDYKVLDTDIRIDNIQIFFPEEKRIILQGLEIENVNPMDSHQVAEAYDTAVKEAKNIADFLSKEFIQFKAWKFSEPAKSFYFRENRHFTGLYRLSVNDVLENRYFDDTIAMGASPVQSSKFANNGIYLTGNPVQYGIPLGCLVPLEPGNLMMIGAKASYSSLASTSAGTFGTGIAEGEASGVTAVYSLLRDIDPSEIIKDRESITELRGYLTRQGMYLPLMKFENANSSNWSYPAVRQLLTMGLIAGGMGNEFGFDKEAGEKDLAVILLNGIYRLGDDKYSLELDSKLRPHFTDAVLTRERAAEILDEMYGEKADAASAYKVACEKGYINDVMQLRLKDKKILTMDDVYYLGDYNIKLFTGKDIKN